MSTRSKAGAAARLTQWQCPLLVLVFVLTLLTQTHAQNAVPPSSTVRPTYACRMQLLDLPQYAGTPTPEMLAGNLGIAMGLQGLLSRNPAASCKALGTSSSSDSSGSSSSSFSSSGSSGSISSRLQSDSQQSFAVEPTQTRHGRRQQRPQRGSPVWAAAVSRASPADLRLIAGEHDSRAGGSKAAAGAVRAQGSKINVMNATAVQPSSHSRIGISSTRVATAAGSLSMAAAGPTGAVAKSNGSSSNGNGSNSSSGGGSSSSVPQRAGVQGHSESSAVAGDTLLSSQRRSRHHQRRQPQLQQQQQLQQQAGPAAAAAGRHLLAEPAGWGADAADDEAWLQGLFADEGGGAAEDNAEPEAFLDKQFCSKGTWMAGISSSQDSPVTLMSAPAAPSNASLASAAAADAGSTSPSSGALDVGIAALQVFFGKPRPPKQQKPLAGNSKPAPFDKQPSSKPGKHPAPSPRPRPPPRPRPRTGFRPVWGDDGLWISESGVVPADATVAVGQRQVLHVVNSLVKVMPIHSTRGVPSSQGTGAGPTLIVTLPDFFGLVASNCDGGYITPSAAFDKQVGRFIVTAVCGGDANQVLLAVSQTADAAGGWLLYAFPGYVTYKTPMACTDGKAHFNPTSIHSRVSYNRDGVFISFVQNCPLCNVPRATGSVLFALPKWALYTGATHNVMGPVYTGADVLRAVGQSNGQGLSAESFRQLEPVLPQRPVDVQADTAYFINDPVSPKKQRTQLTAVALINTGSLWHHSGGRDDPVPLLVARVTGRGVDCSISSSTQLQQPQSDGAQIGEEGSAAEGQPAGTCAGLDAGATTPAGFWSGGAALFANQLYVVDRGPDLRSKGSSSSSGSNSTFPTVYWAVLTPSLCATGTCAAFMGQNWGYSEGWNWTTAAWNQDSAPKKQRAKFFGLQPHRKPGKGSPDSLAAYLNSRAGSRTLQAASAASPAPNAAAAKAEKQASAPQVIANAGTDKQPVGKQAAGAKDGRSSSPQPAKPNPGSAAPAAAAVSSPAPSGSSNKSANSKGAEGAGKTAGNRTVAATAAGPAATLASSRDSHMRKGAIIAASLAGQAATLAHPPPNARITPFFPPPAAPRRSPFEAHTDSSASPYDDSYSDSYDSSYDEAELDTYRGAGPAGGAVTQGQQGWGSGGRWQAGSSRVWDSREPLSPGTSAGLPPAPAAIAVPVKQLPVMAIVPAQAPAAPSPTPAAAVSKLDSNPPSGPGGSATAAAPGTPTAGPAPQQAKVQDTQGAPAGAADADADAALPDSLAVSDDWPVEDAVRAPKPFTPPAEDDAAAGTANQPQGSQQRRDYDYPYDEPPCGGPSCNKKGGPHAKELQEGSGGGAFKWAKHLFATKKELAKKTVWELMLYAANRTASPGTPSHQEYYEVWRDYASVRRVYLKLQLEPRWNPCKFYRDWYHDTKVTFGVLVPRRGVIDPVTNAGQDPVGLAFPQVVVRDGAALVVYSYSGPHEVPGGGAWAYPGVGFSVIPPGQALGSPAFNMLQPGAACIYQGPNRGRVQQAWGSYSGADIHYPSGVAYTAVEYATRPGSTQTLPSNAGTWLEAFAPAEGGRLWAGGSAPRPPQYPSYPPALPPPSGPGYGSNPSPYDGGYKDGGYKQHQQQPGYGGTGDSYADPGPYSPHSPYTPESPYSPQSPDSPESPEGGYGYNPLPEDGYSSYQPPSYSYPPPSFYYPPPSNYPPGGGYDEHTGGSSPGDVVDNMDGGGYQGGYNSPGAYYPPAPAHYGKSPPPNYGSSPPSYSYRPPSSPQPYQPYQPPYKPPSYQPAPPAYPPGPSSYGGSEYPDSYAEKQPPSDKGYGPDGYSYGPDKQRPSDAGYGSDGYSYGPQYLEVEKPPHDQQQYGQQYGQQYAGYGATGGASTGPGYSRPDGPSYSPYDSPYGGDRADSDRPSGGSSSSDTFYDDSYDDAASTDAQFSGPGWGGSSSGNNGLLPGLGSGVEGQLPAVPGTSAAEGGIPGSDWQSAFDEPGPSSSSGSSNGSGSDSSSDQAVTQRRSDTLKQQLLQAQLLGQQKQPQQQQQAGPQQQDLNKAGAGQPSGQPGGQMQALLQGLLQGNPQAASSQVLPKDQARVQVAGQQRADAPPAAKGAAAGVQTASTAGAAAGAAAGETGAAAGATGATGAPAAAAVGPSGPAAAASGQPEQPPDVQQYFEDYGEGGDKAA